MVDLQQVRSPLPAPGEQHGATPRVGHRGVRQAQHSDVRDFWLTQKGCRNWIVKTHQKANDASPGLQQLARYILAKQADMEYRDDFSDWSEVPSNIDPDQEFSM